MPGPPAGAAAPPAFRAAATRASASEGGGGPAEVAMPAGGRLLAEGLLDEPEKEPLDEELELEEPLDEKLAGGSTEADAPAAGAAALRRKTRGCGDLFFGSFLVRGRATMFGSSPFSLLALSRSCSLTLTLCAS